MILIRDYSTHSCNTNFEHKQKTYVDDLIDKRNILILTQWSAILRKCKYKFTKMEQSNGIDTGWHKEFCDDYKKDDTFLKDMQLSVSFYQLK